MDYSSNNNIINHNHNQKIMTMEDVDAAKRLLGSILYIQDPAGRSFLHTKNQLSWSKALLDRAHGNGSTAAPNNANNKPKTIVGSTLLQRRFLLQKDRESGYTPLHRAIIEGNLAAILLFLRHAMDTKSTGRFTQRPLQVLRSSETLHAGIDSSSNNSSDNLLQMMATAVDKEGLTPLQLMGKLQKTELFNCRKALEACQPQVDQRATIRLRPRQNSFAEQEEVDEVDFFSENADLLQGSDNDVDDAIDEKVSYACEVVTFGRPQHYALGVAPGISSSSTSKDNTQYSYANTFSTHRVQEFAQETVGREGGAIAIAAATHHTLVVTKNGHLYACGLGKGGRLGLGDDHTRHCPLPKRVLGPLQRRCVVNVAAAENHSLCVTKDGMVFSWGSNRFGQLGDSAVAVSAGSRSVPRRVDDLKQHPCVTVAAGERHSVALSRKGEVYVWGDNACGQLGVPRRSGVQKVQRVEALWKSSIAPKIALAVAAADQSTLVLTAASPAGLTHVNSIYEWGHGNHVPIKVHLENARAKDSNGPRDDANTRKELVSRAERVINPVAIASGKYHNAAITSDGLVYTWGLHAESLGRNTNSSTKQQQRRNSSPQLVSGLLAENGGGAAVAVAASDQRTAVVCDNGALFTWGTTDGKDVLGHEGVRWQHLPRQVPGVHRAVNVAVAKEHTVLLIGASFPVIQNERGVLSLDLVAARSAAKHVDLFNVIPISIMAERTEVNSQTREVVVGFLLNSFLNSFITFFP
jgi:alpha-tubulin suppressor-like RCC1 family protein/ankyrin repeat protein